MGGQANNAFRKKRKLDRFKQGGAYHKDYAIDPQTGRIRGHGLTNTHGTYPHVNIKRTDGTLVLIDIVGGN